MVRSQNTMSIIASLQFVLLVTTEGVLSDFGCLSRSDPNGLNYTGNLSTTIYGIPCQEWSADTPHKKVFWPDNPWEHGNNCRNPDGSGRPWCYTIDPEVRFGYCAVERCPGDECGNDEFECANKKECIPLKWFCDGTIQCSDRSDELRITSTVMSEDMKMEPCRYDEGTCWISSDCKLRNPNVCRKSVECSEMEFTCEDGSGCIKSVNFCNGVAQCLDGSDERRRNFHSNTSGWIPCRQHEYICVLPKYQAWKRIHICVKSIECERDQYTCPDGSGCLGIRNFCSCYSHCSDNIDRGSYFGQGYCRSETPVCIDFAEEQRKEIEKGKNKSCRDCTKPSDPRGIKYLGLKNHTLSGWECQRWDVDEPHRRYHWPFYPSLHENYCRNPNGETERPWCYTTNPDKRWDICDLDVCSDCDCDEDEFSCDDRSECFPLAEFCNGFILCEDMSDEIAYADQSTNDEILCDGRHSEVRTKCLLPTRYICDNVTHCEDGVDECLCGNGDQTMYLDQNCFRCLSYPHIVIPIGKLYDGIIDCPDLTDECLCPTERKIPICYSVSWDFQRQNFPQIQFLVCLAVSIGGVRGVVVVIVIRAINWKYRRVYHVSGKMRFECMANTSSHIFLEMNRVCDGRSDCKNSEDEIYCDSTCEDRSLDYGSERCNFECIAITGKREIVTSCDGKPDCYSDVYGEECRCPNTPEFCHDVKRLGDESHLICSRTDNSSWTVFGLEICNGVADCINMEDELGCAQRFYCKSGFPINIAKEKLCDQFEDCSDGSDERDCSFHCEDGGVPLLIKSAQICDGTQDCSMGADECQPECINSAFSDTKSMIKSTVVVAIVWVISFVAFFGNAFTFYHTLKDIILKHGKLSPNHEISKVLILNLSLADLLVGVYTFAICIRNAMGNGRYCFDDRAWRSGGSCAVLGGIIVMGSEQSVLTMLIITIFRLLVTKRPLHELSTGPFWMGITMCWLQSLMLAFVPILPFFEDSFVGTVWYGNNAIFSTVHKNQILDAVRWLSVMNTSPNKSSINANRGTPTWSDMQRYVTAINKDFKINQKFGFYSSHGVCLPTLFPDPTSGGAWWYSLIFVGMNFAAFFFMVVGYIFIYKSALDHNIARPEQVQNTIAIKMQKKLTRIIVTDFICWMPICVMVFLQVSGTPIPNDAYLPVGLIIIPINSALNPFLYSNAPDAIWSRMTVGYRCLRNHSRRLVENQRNNGVVMGLRQTRERSDENSAGTTFSTF